MSTISARHGACIQDGRTALSQQLALKCKAMSFVIYDLEDDIRKLLSLDDFLNGLSPHEFIEELSKDHILKGAEVKNLAYLDPKPYIRTFESTLRHIKQLAEEAQVQSERALKSVAEFELSHSKNVLQLSSKVEDIVSKFDHLDLEISSITEKIDPLNQSLNKITKSRDRSMETIFLIRSYHGFYTKEKYDPLEQLRISRSPELWLKCAKTLNSLMTLAKQINLLTGNLPKVTKCALAIDKYSEMMEQKLVERFEIAFEENDFEEMAGIAKVLYDFNGGGGVVLAFMNKCDLFLPEEIDSEEGVYSVLDSEEIWKKLSDPNEQVPCIFENEVTEHLLNRLKVSVKGQARIIKQVFEQFVPVLKVMVQRVYAQIVQNKVATLLLYSQQAGSLAHVRVLHALFVLVGDFTKDMKEFFVANDFDENNEIGTTLDQCYYDLFIQFLSDDSYFKLEKDMLENIIYGIAHEFTSANEKFLSKRELETKLQEHENEIAVLNMTAVGSHDKFNERSKFLFVDKRRLKKFKDVIKVRFPEGLSIRDSAETPLATKALATLKIANVQVVLKIAIEAIARILELNPSKAPEYALEIMEILVFDFGGLYIGSALEVAYASARLELNNATNSRDPPMNYLKIFNSTSEILYLLSSCIKKVIMPCTVNNPAIRGRIVSLTNSFIQRCETSLNLILETVVEIFTERSTYLLLRQKKKDFLCDTIDDVQDYTEVCEALSDFLIHSHSLFKANTNNDNLVNVLVKIGMITLNLLLDHFKKFSVNSTGGIVLTQDVIRYQSVIDSWDIPELSERFQILREISNLFTVQPNLINSLITEGHLASLKVFTVRQYICKRSDFSPSYLERFFGRKQAVH